MSSWQKRVGDTQSGENEREREKVTEVRMTYGGMEDPRTVRPHAMTVSSFKGATSQEKKQICTVGPPVRFILPTFLCEDLRLLLLFYS